ncbi:sigma factor G inhibitor Gin [Bacillaceae bacterium SIJ1]|uniref:sigma factor G inhibitor Gin n=1 Tax=Litoribacterium kuwaitense TaxID=1398745 RepID=UPI0013ECC826|nr:sigma factor G inhibitor Gin [Litoribacterium kuwaitense]NGP45777.1 sigma factor G inhibitor Gin [Litoribacterium kuwaitense]
MEKYKGVCVVCEEQKQRGIYVYHRFICTTCEQRILNTPPEDPSYSQLVQKLKDASASTMST